MVEPCGPGGEIGPRADRGEQPAGQENAKRAAAGYLVDRAGDQDGGDGGDAGQQALAAEPHDMVADLITGDSAAHGCCPRLPTTTAA